MEQTFSFSYTGSLEHTINGSGNIDQQMASLMDGLRGKIEAELSKALASAGISPNVHRDLSDALTRSVEQQITQALAGIRRGNTSDTPCENVTLPTGRQVSLSCIAPDNKSIINLSADEYRTVAKEMQDTIVDHAFCSNGGGCFSKYEIIKVQKLLNTEVYEQYLQIKAEVIAEHGSANEHMLFHGSNRIPEIVQTGFNTVFAKDDGLFGAGIYFAKHSSKSNQYAFGYLGGTGCPAHGDKNCFQCERQLLFCRVILGKEYAATKTTRVKSLPSGYHSLKGVTGRGLKYPEYVVYRGKQAYPEYIITYKIVE